MLPATGNMLHMILWFRSKDKHVYLKLKCLKKKQTNMQSCVCGLHTSIDIRIMSVSISVSRNFDRMAMARRTSSRLSTGIESCCKWSSFFMVVSLIFFPNSSFRYLQSISLQAWVSNFRDFFSGSVYKWYSVTVGKLPYDTTAELQSMLRTSFLFD